MSKCAEGCICGKHRSISPKCKEGCECKRHGCVEGCVCGRHQKWTEKRYRAHQLWLIGRWQEEGRKEAYGEKLRNWWGANDGFKVLRGQQEKERWQNPVFRAREHERRKKLWQQEDYRNRVTKNSLLAVQATPNKAEMRLLRLLEPEGFRYVGDGQLVVGGRCPDFWDGGSRLVELYGDYWHRGQDPQERIGHFARHGYGCAVVWEHELPDLETLYTTNRRFSFDYFQFA